MNKDQPRERVSDEAACRIYFESVNWAHGRRILIVSINPAELQISLIREEFHRRLFVKSYFD